MLLIGCLLSIASCQKPLPPSTVEVPATVKGCGDAIIQEHSDIMAENIRLKAALKFCQQSIEQNR